jgi:hypothetical protein
LSRKLYTIKLTPAAQQDFGILRKNGTAIKTRLRRTLDNLALDCTRAFQSAVPIDTGELRAGIDYKLTSDTSAEVYLEEFQHQGSRRGKPISSTLLAFGGAEDKFKYLQDTRLKRSRSSDNWVDFPSAPARSKTAGWEKLGKKYFLDQYKKVLK